MLDKPRVPPMKSEGGSEVKGEHCYSFNSHGLLSDALWCWWWGMVRNLPSVFTAVLALLSFVMLFNVVHTYVIHTMECPLLSQASSFRHGEGKKAFSHAYSWYGPYLLKGCVSFVSQTGQLLLQPVLL